MKENLKKRNTSSALNGDSGSDKKPLIQAEGEELNNSKPKYNHSKSNVGGSTTGSSSAANYDDDDDSDYDYDEQLPYGGKVYLARRKKADTWLCIGIQVSSERSSRLTSSSNQSLAQWSHGLSSHFVS